MSTASAHPPNDDPPSTAAVTDATPTGDESTTTGLGVDVGGTGIKVGLVDLERGELVGERITRPTPQPATPEAVAATIAELVSDSGWDGPVGIALPSVIHEGVARIAYNIDTSWIGCDVVDLFDRHLPGRSVVMLNDADAAGLTEVHYGAAEGVEGLVILLTFGTGIGSALLFDGRLVPNSELGHMMVEDIAGRGFDETEHLAAASVRARDGLAYEEWAPHVSNVLRWIEDLLWPRAFVLGGGVSEEGDRWIPLLTNRTPVRAAVRLNDAGIIGAAAFAAGRSGLLDLGDALSGSDL